MRLRADLHLHDEESRIPDERLGRLLGFSETWVTLEQQRRVLASNGVELLTITNHNNARSCWRLLEAGHDVLPGAEFTCHFRQIDLSIHVLTYGFTPAQEARLNGLRRDALKFLSFCLAHELPTVLAHPLHFYSRRGLAVDDFNLLYVVFDRFEVLNGQREPWSNLLALAWVNSFSEEKCASVERRFGLKRADFCCLKEKALTGGSDDHYALYTGGTTTSFDLSGSTADMPTSARARLALWTGKTRPEGVSARFENHALRLLAYLCQLVEYPAAPGFWQIARREGPAEMKAQAFALAGVLRAVRGSRRLRKGARDVLKALAPSSRAAADGATCLEGGDAGLLGLGKLAGLPAEQKLEAQAQWARACRRRLARDPLDVTSDDAASVAAVAAFLWRARRTLIEASLFAGLRYGAAQVQRSGREFGSRLARDIGSAAVDWQVSDRLVAAAMQRAHGDEQR